MSEIIITISREFGCNAREVARRLASRKHIKLYDQDLVDLTAQKAGMNLKMLQEKDESRYDKKSIMKRFSYGSSTEFYSDKAIQAQVQVIRDIANKDESCIIFGRCGDYILRKYPHILKFYLYAPLDKRIAHIGSDYALSLADAKKLVKRVDKQRANYYNYVTGMDREDLRGKDVMINVAAYDIDETVELMVHAIEIYEKSMHEIK